MKRGKSEKLKQKKANFKAKQDYYQVQKKRYYRGGRRQRVKYYGNNKYVGKIKYENFLFGYAKEKRSAYAVKNRNLRQENKLLELINGEYRYEMGVAAVGKIKNLETLINIIHGHYGWHIREAALEKIHPCDESVFIDVALNDNDYKVRRCAVKYIKYQDALVYLSRNDDDAVVRRQAIKKIRNMDIIVYVAKHDSNWRVREDAIGLITDVNLLKEVLKHEKNLFLKEVIENRIEQMNA